MLLNYRYILTAIYLLLLGCNQLGEESPNIPISLEVTATAYNALPHQTNKDNPRLAAWGDLLQDGEKAVAVSRDLIALGLDHNEEMEIEGLKGTFIVKDKMNRKWQRKIDIFMGLDEEAAREWGHRKVEIRFNRKDRPKDKFSRLQLQMARPFVLR